MKSLFKILVKYPLEFLFFIFFFTVFKILPLRMSRALGILITTSVGPFLPIHNLLIKNLSIAFHDKDKKWINDAANRVWKNLGYTVSEYAHMNSILKSKIEVINNEFSDDVFNENEHSVIVSGHSSNWEIPGMALRSKMNRVSAIVREPNNPLINFVVKQLRHKYSVQCYSKNRSGTRQLLNQFNKGSSIALLADQQLSSGTKVKFFNKELNISSLPAQIALKAKCKIFLAWPIRTNDNNFKFEVVECIDTKDKESNEENIYKISAQISSFYQKMIAKYPEQYFWFHNRWKI